MHISKRTIFLVLILIASWSLSIFAADRALDEKTLSNNLLTPNRFRARKNFQQELTPAALKMALDDFQVNENIGGCGQFAPAVAVDGSGNYIMVWHDERNGNSDIYAQRFSQNGMKLGENFQINDGIGLSSQIASPGIAIDGSGNFVVVWAETRNGGSKNIDIYGQRFNANGIPQSENFLVNEDNLGVGQDHPRVASDIRGNFMIVWQDERNGNYDIYAQRFNLDGVKQGGNFQINDNAGSSEQAVPSIAMNVNGNCIVVWSDYRKGNHDIYAQRYNEAGTKQGANFIVNDDGGDNWQYDPDVAIDKNGNFIIVWTDYRNKNYDIYAQRYKADGAKQGSNFQVSDNSGTTTQSAPAVEIDGNGNFVVLWQDTRNGDYDIYAQYFNSGGSKQGGNYQVSSENGNNLQNLPALAMAANGNWLAVWYDFRNGEKNTDIYAQRFTGGSTKQGTNFQVNNEAGSSWQDYPDIAANSNGNYVVVWRDERHGDYDVYAQLFSTNGPMGANFRVNDDNGNSLQGANTVAIDNAGNFIIVWQDERNGNADIYAQRCTSNGTKVGANFLVNDQSGASLQSHPAIAIDANGNFIVVWQDDRNGNWDIYAQRFNSNGTKQGSNFRVNEGNEGGRQYNPAAVMDGSGKFVIVWQDQRNGHWDIYAQRYASNGIKQGSNFKVNDDSGIRAQIVPAIAMDVNGNFIVVWNDERTEDYDIYAQRYANNAATIGTNMRINQDGAGNQQFNPAIAIDNEGNFVIVWQDFRNGYYDSHLTYYNSDIYAQRFDNQGSMIGENYRVDNDSNTKNQQVPNIELVNNQIYYVWFDSRIPGQGYDIFSRIDEFKSTAVEDHQSDDLIIENFQLFQNYPNPFNPNTAIRYTLSQPSYVSLKVYNMTGQVIANLVKNYQVTGEHQIEWNALLANGEQASSGIYWCHLKVGNMVQVRKMILAK
jgi:hypothetical protein